MGFFSDTVGAGWLDWLLLAVGLLLSRDGGADYTIDGGAWYLLLSTKLPGDSIQNMLEFQMREENCLQERIFRSFNT